MVEIKIDYEGELHCSAVHGPSGQGMTTDAPVDNCGRGASFSPTDLVATALGSCIATTMAIVAGRKQIELQGSRFAVRKIMSEDAPRRIARLEVDAFIPLGADHPERKLLEAAANGCPVTRSLHPDVEIVLTWQWHG
jgi:putative redox protein